MTGSEYEKLQDWQQQTTGRRVDVTLDYRQWEERFIERIMVFDSERGMFWTIIEPEYINRIDMVLHERSVKLAREAIAENTAVLDKLTANNCADKATIAAQVDGA